ncbi:SagB/ThcOx family dehydrogenase [Saccharopolyspora sp. CA-218241]|uniref:SagB/ThcOx family dehydrogenase n=1 Tax=Saccharopolyspora sp. CA-218241 TaxID=3240027 RepID=UPI003D9617D6
MGNWDLDIGEHYLRRTVHEAEELFAEVLAEEPIGADPLPFKVYRGVPRYRLPEGLPLEIGDARRCFADVPTSGDTPGGEPDGLLAALLYYAYGFSRWDEGPGAVWPYHRVVPSARCYFPTELSLWIPRTGGIPAGLYHYDPLHHSLALLRGGDLRGELGHLLGTGLDDVRCVLLLSSLFWKNAFKYRGYSYRLCAQEAGMVAGNALLVAGALGLRGAVHYQFPDRRAGALLGLRGGEEQLFAALPLRSASAGEPGPVPPPPPRRYPTRWRTTTSARKARSTRTTRCSRRSRRTRCWRTARSAPANHRTRDRGARTTQPRWCRCRPPAATRSSSARRCAPATPATCCSTRSPARWRGTTSGRSCATPPAPTGATCGTDRRSRAWRCTWWCSTSTG